MILSELIFGKQPDWLHSKRVGISNITLDEIETARLEDKRIKLIASLEKKEDQLIASVQPKVYHLNTLFIVLKESIMRLI